MAPLATEPRQILIVLNLAKRKALYTLVTEIIQYMRSQLRLDIPQNPQLSSNKGDVPLFVANTSRDPFDDGPENAGRAAGPPRRTMSAPVSSPELVRLRRAALAHFDAWQKDLLDQLKALVAQQDDAGVVVDRRERANKLARKRAEIASPGESLIDFGGGADQGKLAAETDRNRAVARLQESYHPVPTRLTTISVEDKEETLSCILLLLLSTGKYMAESRTLAIYLTSAFGLPLSVLNTEEAEIAKLLIEKSTSEEAQRHMSAEAEAQKRKQENQTSRMWKVGLGTVAGAALVGITGGLAAPVVAGAIGGLMGTVGLGGLASFMGVFWMNGALVGALFGAFGAKMTGEMVDRYAREVRDFKFIPLKNARDAGRRREAKDAMRLRVTIGVNGWLTEESDIIGPWKFLADDSEVFALRYEVDSLMGLGQSLKDLVSSRSWNMVKAEILKRTVLATLWSALWPAYLLSAAAGVDNPFSLARNRSEKAGEILADAIINKVQGERPVTLIGYSLGARAIYSCLKSLAARQAFGLVDTVVFIGAPVPSDSQHWQLMRSVVSGKIYNVYSENDFLLAFLYRATSIQLGVAGLQPIQGVEGIENVNLSKEVQGHLRYAGNIAKILDRCGFPVVEGAAGPIEKEQDTGVITMDDLDSGPRTGTLIDFGDLTIGGDPPPPRGHGKLAAQKVLATPSDFSTISDSTNRPKGQTQTQPKMSPSAMLSAEHNDPLGGGTVINRETVAKVPSRPGQLSSSHTWSAPVVPTATSQARQKSPVSPSPPPFWPAASPTTVDRQLESPPAPSAPSSSGFSGTTRSIASVPAAAASAPVLATAHDNDDDDSDEEDYGGGIKMVDNDEDDYEYLEPTPLDDDDNYHAWK
ncbi:Protein of unknown function (DUF726) domain containing protein [Rhypophila decipiens]